MELQPSQSIMSVGKSFTVEVHVKDIPKVYGADIRLNFDPAVHEVVDMDPVKDGIQFQRGDFLNSTTSYELQNSVSNDGKLDYA